MKGSGRDGTSKRIVIVTRNGKKIFGDWYDNDKNSPITFPTYSKCTQQDFNQLTKLLDETKFKLIDYERWYVEKGE